MEITLKEKFLQAYPGVPEALRSEIIAVVNSKTYNWDSIYFEVNNDTPLAEKLLNTLKEIGLI